MHAWTLGRRRRCRWIWRSEGMWKLGRGRGGEGGQVFSSVTSEWLTGRLSLSLSLSAQRAGMIGSWSSENRAVQFYIYTYITAIVCVCVCVFVCECVCVSHVFRMCSNMQNKISQMPFIFTRASACVCVCVCVCVSPQLRSIQMSAPPRSVSVIETAGVGLRWPVLNIDSVTTTCPAQLKKVICIPFLPRFPFLSPSSPSSSLFSSPGDMAARVFLCLGPFRKKREVQNWCHVKSFSLDTKEGKRPHGEWDAEYDGGVDAGRRAETKPGVGVFFSSPVTIHETIKTPEETRPYRMYPVRHQMELHTYFDIFFFPPPSCYCSLLRSLIKSIREKSCER